MQHPAPGSRLAGEAECRSDIFRGYGGSAVTSLRATLRRLSNLSRAISSLNGNGERWKEIMLLLLIIAEPFWTR